MKFSLLVPSYNRPEYIRETVDSLVQNLAPDTEIIVSDDASPKREEIKRILAGYIQNGSVRYIQQETNLRWSDNRNALLDAARGDYVILLGDDDRLKPGAVERLRFWTGRHPDAGIIGFGYDAIDEDGNTFFTYRAPKPLRFEKRAPLLLRELLAFDAVPMWSNHPFTMCSKRSVAMRIRYNNRVDIADDYMFLFDAMDSGEQFVVIPESLFEWRSVVVRGSNGMRLSAETSRCARSRGLLLAEIFEKRQVSPEIAALFNDLDFLADFCGLGLGDAESVQEMLRARPVDRRRLADLIESRCLAYKFPLARKLSGMRRRATVFGAWHFAAYIRERMKRRALRIP